jgi:hypothetical protein
VSDSVPETDTVLDLIAVGRSSVDLYGEQIGGRLEDMGCNSAFLDRRATNSSCSEIRSRRPLDFDPRRTIDPGMMSASVGSR